MAVLRICALFLLFDCQEAFHCCLVVACINRINMISIECHRSGERCPGKREFDNRIEINRVRSGEIMWLFPLSVHMHRLLSTRAVRNWLGTFRRCLFIIIINMMSRGRSNQGPKWISAVELSYFSEAFELVLFRGARLRVCVVLPGVHWPVWWRVSVSASGGANFIIEPSIYLYILRGSGRRQLTIRAPHPKSRGGPRIFERGGGGVHLRSTSKKGGARGGPTLGPMLKSLHRGPKGGGPDPPPPPDPLLKSPQSYSVTTKQLPTSLLSRGWRVVDASANRLFWDYCDIWVLLGGKVSPHPHIVWYNSDCASIIALVRFSLSS